MTPPALLRIEHLSLVRQGRHILQNLSLSVAAGVVYSILGPNAAGKSSLAAALMGCSDYAITSGSIRFCGKDVTRLPIAERAKMGLTLAWQEPARFEGLSVGDYLRAGTDARDNGRVEEALKFVLLDPDEYLHRPVDKSLSGGERKRIELAAVFVMRPRLAILDEPDSGIDILALDHIVEMIREMRTRGTSVLLITHREEVAGISDRCSLMCSGRFVKKGNPGEVGKYFRKNCVACCAGISGETANRLRVTRGAIRAGL